MKKQARQKQAAQKRTYMSQEKFPLLTLEKALEIAKAIVENFAGKGAAPHEIAFAIGDSPTSSSWRMLCGSSVAYGLTEGGYNAKQIALSDLGRRIIEDNDLVAKGKALLHPKIMRKFYEKYDKAKFPKDDVAEKVLNSLGVPKERAKTSVQIIKENGKYAGVIRLTRTGLFVALSSPVQALVPSGESPKESIGEITIEEEPAKKAEEEPPIIPEKKTEKNKVFISHGKNKAIVTQLKELLTFGRFIPVVSVEQETTSIPVRDKIFDDMRQCAAAVIHVSSEGEWKDPEGKPHVKINDNVLIEIGAAIALYGKYFVLLVQKGIELPSNLQGLYRCDYEGEKLDYEATMKLLKTFNQFQ